MNRSKGAAALLSALVFPGIGQWYLYRRRMALLFAVPALVAGYFYLSYALDEANTVAGQVLSGGVAPDAAAIAARVAAEAPATLAISGWVFALCWIGSILEALFGRSRQ